jgi:inosine-uridine nucleoside N-ribohydrolase
MLGDLGGEKDPNEDSPNIAFLKLVEAGASVKPLPSWSLITRGSQSSPHLPIPSSPHLSMRPVKIILDTDPGGDDAFALLWLQSLMQQGLVELVAVTTAAGNVAAQRTFMNASQLLGLGGFSGVELGRGVDGDGAIADASHIHGQDGMGGLSAQLPMPTHNFTTARDADDILIEALTAHPGEITVIAIGPLTNLAAAEAKSAGILQKAKEIVVMAGAFGTRGNVTPCAEFNVFFNPKAAQTVFESRKDVVVLSLDVTHRLIFTPEMAKQLCQPRPTSKLAQFLTALCAFMTTTALGYRETGGVSGFLVHDAVTIAYLFYPETLLFRRAQVKIETQGNLTLGQTLVDTRHQPKCAANAWVAMQVDEMNLFASLIEDFKSLIEGSSR